MLSVRFQRSSLAQLLRQCETSARSEVVHSERHDDAAAHFTYSSFTQRRSPFIWVHRRDVCAERRVSSGKGSFCTCTREPLYNPVISNRRTGRPIFRSNCRAEHSHDKADNIAMNSFVCCTQFCILIYLVYHRTPDDLCQPPFFPVSHHV